ncbi:unnamed protein product, partial [Brenthis ino]
MNINIWNSLTIFLVTIRLVNPEGTVYLAQDNSAIHRSQAVQDWLASHPDIEILQWLAKSPDLNPIENLWTQMIFNWDPTELHNQTNVRDLVYSTWESLRGSEMCWNMVEAMRVSEADTISTIGPCPYVMPIGPAVYE